MAKRPTFAIFGNSTISLAWYPSKVLTISQACARLRSSHGRCSAARAQCGLQAGTLLELLRAISIWGYCCSNSPCPLAMWIQGDNSRRLYTRPYICTCIRVKWIVMHLYIWILMHYMCMYTHHARSMPCVRRARCALASRCLRMSE